MAVTFRIVPYPIKRGSSIVEVLKDGVLCAVIYPDGGNEGIKIISAHFAGDLAEGSAFPEGIRMDNGENSSLPVPALCISFDPRPYEIKGGKLNRLRKQ